MPELGRPYIALTILPKNRYEGRIDRLGNRRKTHRRRIKSEPHHLPKESAPHLPARNAIRNLLPRRRIISEELLGIPIYLNREPILLAGGDSTPDPRHPRTMVGKRMSLHAEMANTATPAAIVVKDLGIVPMLVVQTTGATSLKGIIRAALQG